MRHVVRVLLIGSLVVAGLSRHGFAQSGSRWERPPDIAQKLDDYLQRCTAFGFCGSVLVAIDDDVVLSKGYGIADAKTGAMCTPETIFDLGSLSKQFTASTVLALEQRGVLRLDQPLPKFLEDVPKDKRDITLRHLLSHTSGLPRGDANIGSALTDRAEFLKRVLALPLGSKPGTKYTYSNIGYDLVAAIVELATKSSFEDVVREHLFTPAGLTHTTFRGDARADVARAARGVPVPFDVPPPGSLIENDATRFEGRFDEKSLATEGWYSWGLRGAGGVLSTVGDLWTFERILRGDSVLTEASKKQLFTEVRGNYGLGWYVSQSPRGTPWISHGGSTGNGFDVYATRFPRELVFYTVLGNSMGVVPWVNVNLGKLIFGEPLDMPPQVVALDPAALEAHCGVYAEKGSKKSNWRVTTLEGTWVVEALDPAAFEHLTRSGARPDVSHLATSERVFDGLLRDDFAPLEAVDSETHPLFFMRGWWKRLKDHHGKPSSATVLGETSSRQGIATVARVEFERGSELFRLSWSGDTLTGVNIGGPYPSRARFVPISATEAVVHDLVSNKTRATLKFDAAAHEFELDIEGKKQRVKRL